MGPVRLPQDARLPLGHLPEPAPCRSKDPFRRAQGPAGLAGGARRAPRQPAPHHRGAGPHRAGKFQVCALAESGFDPLARTTQFMLTEEAHHMFVGESGVSRVIQRTSQLMKEHRVEDPARVRALGAIDLPTIQRYLNFHYSVTIDLFGSDQSSNAASFYSSGLKGRYEETKLGDDHVFKNDTYKVLKLARA